ncbi:MAG: CoA transferase [Chloroflexi bacterium]|nr:CoA transferase [Chloroflexota bacterium]
MSKKALAGVRLLEVCHTVSGSYCTKLFADLGAEVIKIEPPGVGDWARSREPFAGDVPDRERSLLFIYLNTNKLSVTLHLESAGGKKIIEKMVKSADVLVEDNSPKVSKKLGIDYGKLSKLNSKLVITSVTPFGQTGPYREFKSYHLNEYHAGGDGYLLQSAGYTDREPIRGGGYLGEYEAGMVAAGATMAAIFARSVTGAGQHVDISKQEALIVLNRYNLARYPNEGIVERRSTRGYEWGGILKCKDGYMMMQATEEHHWLALKKLMGHPAWADEEKFKDRLGRGQNKDEVNARITEWMMHHTKEEIYLEGQKCGVPIGPFYSPEEVVDNEHERVRGFFVEFDHPFVGKVKAPRGPCAYSETPVAMDTPSPLLGQHNQEVLERLGYSKEDIVKLAEAGVI